MIENENDISCFSDLTDFVGTEYEKMSEHLGLKKTSDKFAKFIEESLLAFLKIYKKPLFKKAKRELKIKEAIETMPKSKLWKFFHSSLWSQVDFRLTENKKLAEKESIDNALKEMYPQTREILVPTIVSQLRPSQVSDLSQEKKQNGDEDYDF